jgi:hypothetical protein
MQIPFELRCFGAMHALKTVPTGNVDVNSNNIFVKKETCQYVKMFRAKLFVPDSKKTRRKRVLCA